MDNRVFGQIGENAAADVLCAKGFKIVKRNYRCKYGEIDIVAERNGELAFVEVKTRSSLDYGRPAEAVTYYKKQHMKKAANTFMNEMWDGGEFPRGYSFHVMEILVQHIANAF